jgi:hypothetical protein
MKSLSAVLLALGFAVGSAVGQDQNMAINKLPSTETPVPSAVKSVGNYQGPASKTLSTPWVRLGKAGCNQRCVEVSGKDRGVQVKVWDASKAFTKVRLGTDVPRSCDVVGLFGEMRDEGDETAGFAFHDPTAHPKEHSRIHVFKFEGGTASMVFQNEHTGKTREVRLNVICK